MSNDLSEILSLVAKGRMSPAEARALIELQSGKKGAPPVRAVKQDGASARSGSASSPRSEPASGNAAESADHSDADGKAGEEGPDSREGLLAAFDKLRKSVHVDELLKISSGLVQQIAENMPERIERFQESVSNNFNALGFSAGSEGVDAKLSVFRTFHVGASARVSGNSVVGSQWFGVNFDEDAAVRDNKFTAVQFSEVAVLRSDFGRNTLGLSRLSNVTIQESRFEGNRMSRSTFSDVSFAESDFEGSRLLKSEFSRTVLNASRFSGCAFEGVGFEECEFDSCEFDGVTFENCTFRECVFDGVRVAAKEPVRIVGRSATGRVFRRIRDVESLLAALAEGDAGLDDGALAEEEAGGAAERTLNGDAGEKAPGRAGPSRKGAARNGARSPSVTAGASTSSSAENATVAEPEASEPSREGSGTGGSRGRHRSESRSAAARGDDRGHEGS